MNPRVSRWSVLSASALLAALSAFGAFADDTEVYTGQPATSAEGRPNILFVIDTSGSMGTIVHTQEPYDPSVTYDCTASGRTCCPADRIYWKSSSSGLGSDPPTNDQCGLRKQSTSNVTGYVEARSFVCKTAADVIARNGYQPVTKTAQWSPQSKAANSKWTTLRRADTTNYVECGDDSDLTKIATPHGDGSLSYAGNGTNGPFTNDAAQQVNWSGSADTNGSYTYYSSNWLNWYWNARLVDKTRLQIIQEVTDNLLDTITDVNVGLMRFSTDGEGGMVLHEIADIATSRASLKTQVAALTAGGNTPLSETLYEARQYYAGQTWDYGSRSSPAHSVASSLSGTTYNIPIVASCQKNFIVLLTDGEPVSDTGADTTTRIRGMVDVNNQSFQTLTLNTSSACTAAAGAGTNTNGRCLDDVAAFMYNGDISSQAGAQNVTTYTVGFGADVQSVTWATDLLKETARRGGGEFFEAQDTASLTSVFTSIVQEIIGVNTTFTAPTVSVNAFNRTQNLNDLFITVFSAANTFHWPGNVKKYEVQTNGTVVGTNGPAVDPSTGFFRTGAQSFWSGVVDGADVRMGGAASQLPDPATRKVYTDLSSGDLAGDQNNRVIVGNLLITDDVLGGLDPTVTHDELVEWVRGADVDAALAADRDDPRLTMGDPLHARPATVIYGGTQANPDMVLFATTNDGYLHAIDPANGNELWTYVPGPMLRRMTDLYLNKAQNAKRYGLDGSVRVLKVDNNDNGLVDGSDRVVLYFGMGRGGTSYFAVDVTNKNAPRLLWRRGSATDVHGDGTLLTSAERLPNIGQTWSTPVPTKVNINGNVETVVIFGGGYDPTQDNVGFNTDDTGNIVYMLDAFSGNILWASTDVSMGNGVSMQHSIPSDVRVLDLDNNGLADRMYVSDTGARIWRFDIHNGNNRSSLVTGGKFASLGRADGAGFDPLDARRFYYAPDVSLVRTGTQTYLNLAIGSGFRGHPLNRQIRDRFYAIRDYVPFTQKTQSQFDGFTAIGESDLVNVTSTLSPTIPANSPGWRINLEFANGEKVLAEARTFNNKILFTTYLPNLGTVVPGNNSCVARQGLNRLYTVSVKDGSPVLNRDGSTGPDGTTTNPDEIDDRWDELSQSGIAPEPVILFPETSTPTCIVGVESCGVTLVNDPVKTFWNRQDTDNN